MCLRGVEVHGDDDVDPWQNMRKHVLVPLDQEEVCGELSLALSSYLELECCGTTIYGGLESSSSSV